MVLGAGPVGLLAALAAARCGKVTLLMHRELRRQSAIRIDTVPAPFLTLLLEFGIHPARLDVHELHDERFSAWGSASIESTYGPAKAHIERPLLEQALLQVVQASPAITIRIHDPARSLPEADLVLDATGRKAVTVSNVIAPEQPWRSRTFHSRAADSLSRAFYIGAMPQGYVYRVGSARHIMLGIVGPDIAGSAEELEEQLHATGVGWILHGLPRLRSMKFGLGGVASTQRCEPGAAAIPVGDAAFARDILSAQGLAVGCADAMRLAGGELQGGAVWQERVESQSRTHVKFLRETIQRCRFGFQPAWSRYLKYLSMQLETAQQGAGTPAELRTTIAAQQPD